MKTGDKAYGEKPAGLLKNGVWGVAGNLIQLVFVSLFFMIVARNYSVEAFAQFLVATTIYQLVAAFSSMGLSQWFIRSYIAEADKQKLISQFLKTQIGLGCLFYLVNIAFVFGLYADEQIRWLSIVLGLNIVIDNFINAIKSLNVAEARQDKTGKIMVIDGFLRLMTGGLLFVTPFSTLVLAGLSVAVRICTLGLFLKLGTSASLTLSLLARARLSLQDLKTLLAKNWQFVIIGSVSILYWKAGNVIISKMLTLADVADYELAFRVFSIFQILPVIASATIFPQFVKCVQQGNVAALKKLYGFLFVLYTGVAVLAYAFVFSFSDAIIPLAFGSHYPHAITCLQEMFLSFLIMPTVLLQANLLVALGLERKDMYFNLISLGLNIGFCIVGLYFVRSISMVNYAIFCSLFAFHLLQDCLLLKMKLIKLKHCLLFYLIVGCIALGFRILPAFAGLHLFYFAFMLICVVFIAMLLIFKRARIKALIRTQSTEREGIW